MVVVLRKKGVNTIRLVISYDKKGIDNLINTTDKVNKNYFIQETFIYTDTLNEEVFKDAKQLVEISYNNLILEIGSISEKDINKKGGFEHYGVIKNDYIILKGSIPGPQKRGLIITYAIRPTKFVAKKKFEVLELRWKPNYLIKTES